MIKKIAICAILALLVIPAFALAAGQGAGESGKGMSGGKSQQGSAGTCTQEQLGSCQQQGSGNTTSCQMLQVQSREQVRDMLKNMAENQTTSGQGSRNAGSGQAGRSVGMQAAGSAAGILQQEDGSLVRGQTLGLKRFQAGDSSGNSTGTADRIRDRTRDMIMNQTRLQDGSCGGTGTVVTS